MHRRSFGHEFRKNKWLFVMIAPAVAYFLVFFYFPMAGSYMAFTSYDLVKGIFKSPFVGLENFKFLYISGILAKITMNTILYNVAFILVGGAFQISAAIFISELAGKSFKKLTQSMMFLPYFVSYVLIGVFVYQFFNYEHGTLNGILKALHMDPVDVFSNVGIWKYIIVFFSVWKGLGFGMIIYLATIMGINNEINEAAEIDGASIFQRIRYITIPLIIPTFITLLLLSVGSILKGQLDLFYQITGNNGLLFDATEVVDTYVFRALLNARDYGLVSAAGFYQSSFGFVLVLIANYLVKKYDRDYGLF
ncbi:ABC transporter permease [Cohnella soli]|uniref:ABC transporter permease n=1 Tax=Cohnella soli TaxID=425005 RepID=A0ABW0I1Y6_9BACL